MGLAYTLRQSTADAHREVERAPMLKSIFEPGFDFRQYSALLHRWALFFERFDDTLTPLRLDEYRYTPRLPCVESDLAYLVDRVPPQPPVHVSREGWLPRTLSEQLGAAYVLEGSTLGGRVICKRLADSLGSHARLCTAFYSMRTVRWPDFRTWLDEAGAASEFDPDAVVAAAGRTFQVLTDHMQGDIALPIQVAAARRSREPALV